MSDLEEADWQSHVLPHGPLVELSPGLWQVTGTLRRNPLPRNMVLWRTSTGGLLVHSAICLDEAGMAQLDGLGPVTHIVVPCRYHRADAAPFAARYPEAMVLAPACAREAVEKVVEVHGNCEDILGELGIVSHAPLGFSHYELHYELPLEDGSRALVVTDGLFNLGGDPPGGFGGLVLKWMGYLGPLGISWTGRFLLRGNREEYRNYLGGLAEMPRLSVLCVAHGEAVTTELGDALRAAVSRV